MATIDAASVKKLRELTDAGIMDCKRALGEAEGDFERAAAILREKKKSIGVKVGGRATGEGSIGTFVSEDGKKGALVELNCETDFVAKNERFVALCSDLAQRAVALGAMDADTLLNSNGGEADQIVKETMGTVGENIRVARVAFIETEGFVAHYSHHDNKQSALVELKGVEKSAEAEELGRDLSTQVVAMKPQFVSREEIPTDALEKERAIYEQQAAAEGKPEAIQTKIAEGRLNKEFFQAVALLDQPFVKEQKQTVGQYLKASGKGAEVVRFVRFRVGESA